MNTIARHLTAASDELKDALRRIDSPGRMVDRVQVLLDVATANHWPDVAFHLSHAIGELQAEQERQAERAAESRAEQEAIYNQEAREWGVEEARRRYEQRTA